MLLVSALFAFFCYKRQLASVGDVCWRHNPRMQGKQRSNRKEPASNENIAARIYSDGSSSDPIVDPNDTVGFTKGRGINNSRTVCGDYASSDGNNHGFFSSGGLLTAFRGNGLKKRHLTLIPIFF